MANVNTNTSTFISENTENVDLGIPIASKEEFSEIFYNGYDNVDPSTCDRPESISAKSEVVSLGKAGARSKGVKRAKTSQSIGDDSMTQPGRSGGAKKDENTVFIDFIAHKLRNKEPVQRKKFKLAIRKDLFDLDEEAAAIKLF